MSLWLGMMAGSLLAAGGDFEPIATVTVGSGGASSIQFTSIPGTYQHLQVRLVARSTRGVSSDSIVLQVNGYTGTDYPWHRILGDGSTAASSGLTTSIGGAQGMYLGYTATDGDATGIFGGAVIDILDYASASKNTVVRSFSGADLNGSGIVWIGSSLYKATTAISSIKLFPYVGPNWAQHSTAALYGLKAPA